MPAGTFLPPGLTTSDVKITSGGTDNYVMTAVDGETIQGEAKLTFDGSTLTLDGDLTFTGAQAITTSADALTITSAAAATWSTGAGVLTIDGDDGIVLQTTGSGNVTVNEILDVTDGTDASDNSGDTGALRTEGGASIAKKVYIGGELHQTGNATFGGNIIHSSVAKAWCRIVAAGTLVSGSFNVASVTDTGTGNRTINWDTDFADANYTVFTSAAAGVFQFYPTDTFATGSVRMLTYDEDASTLEDGATSTVAFGEQ
jgi:hypothetical protein